MATLNNSSLHMFRFLTPGFWLQRAQFVFKFGRLDREQSAASISEHYDDGNSLFESFLGPDMVYTCAAWTGFNTEASLADAQRTKVDRILQLAGNPTKLLDIGSGWGYLVGAARSKGIEAYGLCNCESMINESRARYGAKLFSKMDYRDLPVTHDHDAITCVEMIEAVPAMHYKDFVAACDRALKPGGRVVMQVINAHPFNNPVASSRNPKPLGSFVTTHIFPGQQVPNMQFLQEAFLESGKFHMLYSESTGHDYARTLAEWNANLERVAARFPPSVVRKYRYYFAFCQAGFHTELLTLTRVVFEKIM